MIAREDLLTRLWYLPLVQAARAEKPFPIVLSYAAAPSYQVGGSSVTRFTHQNSPENSLWRDATSIWPQLSEGHVEDPQHPWPLAGKYTVDITTKRHTHSGDGKCRPCLTCQNHKVQHKHANTLGSATTTSCHVKFCLDQFAEVKRWTFQRIVCLPKMYIFCRNFRKCKLWILLPLQFGPAKVSKSYPHSRNEGPTPNTGPSAKQA